MSSPLVTIGIPTRNRAARLERAVRSALGQEDVEIEVVVSDNASTDGTAELCTALARTDARLRYIRQPTDIGAEANFRAVLDAATTPLFMWLADDDWIDEGYVAACACVLEAHPDHVVVCGRGTYYRHGEYAFSEPAVNLISASARARLWGFFRTVTLNGPFYGVIRRDVLPDPPTRGAVGGDWLLVAALSYVGQVRTVEDVSIHRSVEGASQDPESLRRAYGLTKWQARNWYAVVALQAFRDIRSAETYRGMGRLQRLGFGVAVAVLIVARFGPKTIVARGLAWLGLFDRVRRTIERRRR